MALKIDGFKDRNKDDSEKHFDPAENKTCQLRYNQTGAFELKLQPKQWFNIAAVGPSSFAVKIVDPVGMWQHNHKQPFKVKWILTEIID